jgi:hypothetical protein
MKGILFGVGETQYQKIGCRDDIDRRAHGPDPLLQAVTIYRWHCSFFFLCRGGSHKEAISLGQPLDCPKVFQSKGWQWISFPKS